MNEQIVLKAEKTKSMGAINCKTFWGYTQQPAKSQLHSVGGNNDTVVKDQNAQTLKERQNPGTR